MRYTRNIILLVFSYMFALSIACNNQSENTDKQDEQNVVTEEKQDGKNVVMLIFASAFEGEIQLVFKDKSGDELEFIEFYDSNVISEYDFISSDDGHLANPMFLNKNFKIDYVEEEGDILDEETGDYVKGMVKKLKSIKLSE